MKIAFSVPTGYHLRELLLPLQPYLEQDPIISQVLVITPGAAKKDVIFPNFSAKFQFIENPPHADDIGHQKFFEIYQPDIIVTDTVGHDPLDYPILKAAAAKNIRTLTFIASWDNVWKIERMIKKHAPMAIADSFIVWNEIMKEHLLRILPGVIPDRIKVIGAPRLDYFSHADNIPSKETIYSLLGFKDTSRPLIHFATTELYPMEYVVKAVHAAIQEQKIPGNPYLYASVHPGGKMENHEGLKKYGVEIRYSFGRTDTAPHPDFTYHPSLQDIYNLVGLFIHANVLINHSSSTALESLLAHTPVINIKYGKPWDWFTWYRSMVYRDFHEHYVDLTQDNPTYIVKNTNELIAAVNDALTHPDAKQAAMQQTITRMVTTIDGTASQKVLDEIKAHARPS